MIDHLWAWACFHVGADFVRTLGWFDENFYPAYHEDQEMSLRAARLGASGCELAGIDAGGVLHEGSQTLHSAPPGQQHFIRGGQRISGEYLERRWGPLPPTCDELPLKEHPFDAPGMHPADWSLDLEMRAQIAQRCEDLAGVECPLIYHRVRGGLG